MSWSSYAKSAVKTVGKALTGKLARKEPVYIPKLQGNLLKGRSALITGGSSGIGYATAEAFLVNGADVVITGRDEERLKTASNSLQATGGGSCGWIVLDNTKPSTFDEALQHVLSISPQGRVDILVNNAGVLKGGPFGKVTTEDYDQVLDTNLRGAYFLSQTIANYWKDVKIEGNILNVASSSSLRPALSPYTLSKWGVRGLTLGLAKALIPYGIVVNGIAPGPTATSMLMGDDRTDLNNDSVPAGRYAAPEEIANMAVVLVSDLGRMVVGDIVYMTGGSGVITYDDMKYDF